MVCSLSASSNRRFRERRRARPLGIMGGTVPEVGSFVCPMKLTLASGLNLCCGPAHPSYKVQPNVHLAPPPPCKIVFSPGKGLASRVGGGASPTGTTAAATCCSSRRTSWRPRPRPPPPSPPPPGCPRAARSGSAGRSWRCWTPCGRRRSWRAAARGGPLPGQRRTGRRPSRAMMVKRCGWNSVEIPLSFFPLWHFCQKSAPFNSRLTC